MKLHEQKKQLRNELIQQRSYASASEREEKSKQIMDFLLQIDEFKRAKSVFCYISYLDEVDTHALIEHFLQFGLDLAVPKIISKTEMYAVPLHDLSNLEPDRMGILTPKSDQQVSGPFDIAITPGLGFSTRGHRLGYGRGYYDRWFSENSVCLKIGIAFECQIVTKLPTEDTDIPVDMLVTERRFIDMRKNYNGCN